MNCKQIVTLLSPLLEGELSETTGAQVRAHLEGCPNCAAEYIAMQRATDLLLADASQSLPTLPDLLPAFQQRLVTHPRRSPFRRPSGQPAWSWLLPRMAVVGLSTVMLGAFVRHKLFPYSAAERILIATQNELGMQSFDAPSCVNTTYHNSDAQSPTQLSFSTVWWDNGCAFNLMQKPSRDAPLAYARTYVWSNQGGVFFNWSDDKYSTATGVSWKPHGRVDLNWIPNDPARQENNEVKALSEEASRLIQQILENGKANQVEVSEGIEPVGKLTQRKISLTNINQALRRKPGDSVDNDVPHSLTLWFDSAHRLQRSEELMESHGRQWSRSSGISYPEGLVARQSHARLLSNTQPRNLAVTLPPAPSSGNAYDPPTGVKPTWLNMSKTEQKEVQQIVNKFAVAWAAHDENQLRTLIDTNRLLEITRPEKRNGMTSEDVWRQVWQEPLHRQPRWQSFAITTDFAFEAPFHLQETVPVNVGEWQIHRCLPGLDVLAWLNARQEDGQECKVGVRLYLVKRAEGWKVFQFGRLFNGAATIP